MNRLAHLALGAVLGAALAACGGGGNTVAEGGIGGTGISSGSISAFSSIVLNGTKFDVDAATIRVNGDPNGTESDLEVGYVVRVDGDLAKGAARSVRFDADLIGPVTDLNNIAVDGTLKVMQQDVRVTATTVLAGAIGAVGDIAVTDQVLVSGFRDSSDVLVATHFAVLASDPDTDQVIGTVTVNDQPGEFAIGGLIVNSPADPEVGSTVIVRGTYDPLAAPGPRFQAGSVQPVAGLAKSGAEVELEGIVDSISGDPDFFTVGGVPVDATGAVIVDETEAPATIQENAEVEVEGRFDVAGVIVAERVEVELEDNVEIVAQVANDPGTGDPVAFFNAFGTLYLTANVTAKTRLRDRSAASVDRFSVADLALNDWVELDAYENSAGEVTALKIERFDPDPDENVVLEGIVDRIEATGMQEIVEVLDMTFNVSGLGFDLGSIVVGQDSVELRWDPSTTFKQPNMPVASIEKED